jgi:rhodanese-related sulfurtransferase
MYTKLEIILGGLTLIIIAILVFTMPGKWHGNLQIGPEQVLQEMVAGQGAISPEKAWKAIGKMGVDTLFIDLRHPDQFSVGHIPGAVNIPASQAARMENQKFFDDDPGSILILYSGNQLEANGTWMLLRQMGYDNILVLEGGYEFFQEYYHSFLGGSPLPLTYRAETPRFDLPAIAATPVKVKAGMTGSESSVTGKPSAGEKIIPVKKQKKTVSEGGC